MTGSLYKWSIERYHTAIAAGVFDDQSVELLQGDLVDMAPEGTAHAAFSSDAADYLRRLLGDRAQIRDAKPVTLPNASEPQPDLAIVKPLGSVYRSHYPYPEDIFWVIEYAQSTLAKDLGQKQQIYAAAGIQEYWVVNLQDFHLRVFRDLQTEQYATDLTLTQGTIAPLAFPEIAVEVPRLFS
ncbi:Uma2 family endonuclease [Alkalinema sp. FACHB-956]|uniref:Uma2 family endonuclease n=1 Tax=Alkalinema sp. FACHB-956 TaxID=2692768 RepID=UPI001683079B|nr:Uma2 family endonuclease [Alkalinema sp. FACHB-956]MBD2327201.1 Uma2 family endonuclease [Alkalinema sp. FACHB-956]